MNEKKKTVNLTRLTEISIKEIVDKFPDKCVRIELRGKNTVLILDTCKIVFSNN